MDLPGESVNTLKDSFAADFARTFEAIEKDSSCRAVVFASAKKDFIVGADVKMLQLAKSAREAAEMSRTGQRALSRIADFRVPVVAAIHGDERWTSPLAHRLMEEALPHHLDVYVVPEANPDGWAADTRLNANRVDLNRNFDWRWAPYDGGPTPYSEPEARALAETVLRLQPTLAVWIHQPLGYVAGVGTTNPAYADAWRAPVDLPTRVGLDQHGGGETWTAMVAGFPSILVEMLGDEVYESQFDAHVEGYRRLLELL